MQLLQISSSHYANSYCTQDVHSNVVYPNREYVNMIVITVTRLLQFIYTKYDIQIGN